MAISTVKRLAADIMDVGVNKVRIDPDNMAKASEALTRNDVRGLIQEGIIYKGIFGGRRANKKHTGRGHGSRKGSKNARTNTKDTWMARVRSQRKYLSQLVTEGSLPKKQKRAIYMKVKSGIFKSKKTMHTYLKENNLLNEKK